MRHLRNTFLFPTVTQAQVLCYSRTTLAESQTHNTLYDYERLTVL